MPVGPLFCVLDGRPRGRAWSAGAAREALYLRAARTGARRPTSSGTRTQGRGADRALTLRWIKAIADAFDRDGDGGSTDRFLAAHPESRGGKLDHDA